MSITYTPATNFGAKDSLPTNDPDKVIKGSEFSTEFTAIQTAFGLAAPAASPTFTGTVTIASVDINGGTIDGVTIGGSSAGAGSFTTLTASGDVNFDSGTFFVDASANAVGIGTTNPAYLIDAQTAAGNAQISVTAGGDLAQLILKSTDTAGSSQINFADADSSNVGMLQYFHSDNHMEFTVNNAEAMRLDASGNVGIGTDSPGVKLGVLNGSDSDLILMVRGADNTTEYMALGLNGANGVLTAGASGSESTNMVFRTASSGTEAERMRIDSSGNLLVGTTTASAKLTVEGSGSAAQMVRGFATNASYTGQVIQSLASRNTTNESYEFLRCSVNGVADRLKIYDNGNVENTNNSYGSLSDIKLKENVVDASAQWDDIKALRFRKYNFKEETGQSTHTQIGLIAQEAELVCPGIVKETTDRDQEGNDLGTTTKSIQYSLVYVKAVKALQEAMARIETLEAEVAALKGA
jgi:hypothetical protein